MAQAAGKRVTAKDPVEKLAHRRMTVLELAERLGNVAEACRRGGIDRTSFYDWKRRFQQASTASRTAADRQSHPMTPPEVVARLEALALLHPAYGCNRRGALGLGRPAPSSPSRRSSTIRASARATSAGWRSAPERRAGARTQPRAGFLEKLNPCFKERHVERAAGRAALGRHLHGRHAQGHRPDLSARGGRHLRLLRLRLFARLQAARGGGRGPAQRRGAVLRRLDLPIGAVLTDHGRRVLRHRRQPYELYLALNEIESTARPESARRAPQM